MSTPMDLTMERFVALDGWDLFAEKLLCGATEKMLCLPEDAPLVDTRDDHVGAAHVLRVEEHNAVLIPEIVSPHEMDDRRSTVVPARIDPSIEAISVAAEIVDRARREAEICQRRQPEQNRLRRLLRSGRD